MQMLSISCVQQWLLHTKARRSSWNVQWPLYLVTYGSPTIAPENCNMCAKLCFALLRCPKWQHFGERTVDSWLQEVTEAGAALGGPF